MIRLYCMMLIATLPSLTLAAQDMGRLFLTPAERSMLDQSRRNGGVAEQASPEAERISLDGVVRRTGGKSTAWINGVAQHDGEKPKGVLVLGKPAGSSSASLRLSNGKTVNLKAGQVYHLNTGKVDDVIGEPTENRAQSEAKGRLANNGTAVESINKKHSPSTKR